MPSWRLISEVMENSRFVLSQGKNHLYQRDTINAKDQKNINKYIFNNMKTVNSVFHPWLLRKWIFWVVAPSGQVAFSPLSFKVMYCLHLQGYEKIHGFITQKMKAARPFETSESNYPTTRCKNPEDLLPEHENMSVTNRISQRCVISQWVSGKLPALPSRIFQVVHFSLAYVVFIFALLTFKWTL